MTPLHVAIAKERKRKGLTQQQLADQAKVPQSRISEMERGVTKHVSLEVLERLAEVLGVATRHPYQEGQMTDETRERRREFGTLKPFNDIRGRAIASMEKSDGSRCARRVSSKPKKSLR